jgi:hypothetical protein
MPSCPSDLTQINLVQSTLCIGQYAPSSNWDAANDLCYNQHAGASLCTHQQLRHACNYGPPVFFIVNAVGSWLADRTSDNTALYVNKPDCDDFDDTADANGGTHYPLCCLEWMNY